MNWPAAAYVGGAVLAVAWVRDELARPGGWRRRLVAGWLTLAAVTGLAVSAVLHFPTPARPVVAPLAGPPTEENPAPLRRLDPTSRLAGWRTLAVEVDRLRDAVRAETGEEPVLATMVWTTPGELSFYCHDHPLAYSLGLALADRHSQYDVWRPNPVADAQAFRGRAFVYVGEVIPTGAFDRVSPPVRVVHAEGGVPVASWTVWVGYGFRGVPPVRSRPAGY